MRPTFLTLLIDMLLAIAVLAGFGCEGRDQQNTVTIVEAIELLRNHGLVPEVIPSSGMYQLLSAHEADGVSDVALIGLGTTGVTVQAYQLASPADARAFANGEGDKRAFVTVKNICFLRNGDNSSPQWKRLEAAARHYGGAIGPNVTDFLSAQDLSGVRAVSERRAIPEAELRELFDARYLQWRASAYRQLRIMQSALELYRAYEGQYPWADGDLERIGWEPLIESGILARAPQNPILAAIGDSRASRIAACSEAPCKPLVYEDQDAQFSQMVMELVYYEMLDGVTESTPEERWRLLGPLQDSAFERILAAVRSETGGWIWDSELNTLRVAGFEEYDFDVAGQPDVSQLPFVPEELSIAIMRYEHELGMSPFDDRNPNWSSLIDAGYLERIPLNPLSPRRVAGKVVCSDDPLSSGKTVDPKEAGWLYNEASRMVYAAGLE